MNKGFSDSEWPTWKDSRLVHDFEPEYELVIVPLKDYRIEYVFWRGGNRMCDTAAPSYEEYIK